MARFTIEIPEPELPWEWGLYFVGQVAHHSAYTYHIISEVLFHHKVESIIEIGTQHGGLTMYLGMWGVRLGIPVYSFDIQMANCRPVADILNALNVSLFEVDVFSNKGTKLLVDAVGGEPTYLIVDGGNKAKEFQAFAPMVPIGSAISVHDYSNEIQNGDIDEVIQFEAFRQCQWMAHNVQYATLTKIGDL